MTTVYDATVIEPLKQDRLERLRAQIAYLEETKRVAPNPGHQVDQAIIDGLCDYATRYAGALASWREFAPTPKVTS